MKNKFLAIISLALCISGCVTAFILLLNVIVYSIHSWFVLIMIVVLLGLSLLAGKVASDILD